jgi:SAM-dependent methyltransferase
MHGTMSSIQVNYDQIAPTYNRRFAGSGRAGTTAALLGLAAELRAERILEVGCGTGHWLAGLAPFAGQVHGLDLSAGMLAQAQQRREPLRLVQGRAGCLPYAGNSFDLVYCVNGIHHFQDQAAFVGQAYRLLRPGGALAVIGTDPHTRLDTWYVYDYFEGTRETDLTRFPSWGTVLDWMADAGFSEIAWRWVERIRDPKVGRAVLDDPFLQKDACSQLALLTSEAYAAGLRRIEATLAQAELAGAVAAFRSELTVAMLTGRTAFPGADHPATAAKVDDASAAMGQQRRGRSG